MPGTGKKDCCLSYTQYNHMMCLGHDLAERTPASEMGQHATCVKVCTLASFCQFTLCSQLSNVPCTFSTSIPAYKDFFPEMLLSKRILLALVAARV
jgi:hypothetical protein